MKGSDLSKIFIGPSQIPKRTISMKEDVEATFFLVRVAFREGDAIKLFRWMEEILICEKHLEYSVKPFIPVCLMCSLKIVVSMIVWSVYRVKRQG